MTLQPNFLPVGSIVMSNNIPCTVDGVLKYGFISTDKGSGHLDEFYGIKLTPEILTEWCNMKLERKQLSLNIGGELMDYATDGKMCIYCSKKGWTLDSIVSKDTVYFQYLHELQNLFLGMKQVLPITIK